MHSASRSKAEIDHSLETQISPAVTKVETHRDITKERKFIFLKPFYLVQSYPCDEGVLKMSIRLSELLHSSEFYVLFRFLYDISCVYLKTFLFLVLRYLN